MITSIKNDSKKDQRKPNRNKEITEQWRLNLESG